MKRISIGLILAIIIMSLTLIPASANGGPPWLPESAPWVEPGYSYDVFYTTEECVDLFIEMQDQDGSGEDLLGITIEGFNTTDPNYYYVSANISLNPGTYLLGFKVISSEGNPGSFIQYRLTENTYTGNYKYIPDTTPPVVAVDHLLNPAGKPLPFYVLSGTDNQVCGEDVVFIYITDTGSGTLFGPFQSGISIHYIIDEDAIPSFAVANGPKNLDYNIKAQGAGQVTAVDASGNSATVVLE